ncbi:MAG: hypothetical protein IPH57_16925 [Saprospiraceae bacterium]|nr:hypothetical protein [Saprospiraceae bacterium]
MGIFSEIKRLIFGAKAVTNESIKKTTEKLHDSTEHLLDVNEDFLRSREKGGSASNVPMENTDEGSKKSVLDEIKDSEIYKKTSETLDMVGDSILDTGEKFMEKSKEFIDGPGKKAADKFGEVSEKVGEKIFEGGKVLFDKASDLVSDLGEKLDETIQKAEKFAKEEKKDKSEFAETDFKVKASELNDKEDFFNKADRFSSGDFSDFPKTTIEKGTSEKQKTNKEISGFDDTDNDGDSLIDDAKIVEEEKEEKKS